ncbi:MAG: hypothetical protein K6E91_01505 [Butyrivibrio sp.]|nr:hypothetical protein [Butyrivibrio sp.]
MDTLGQIHKNKEPQYIDTSKQKEAFEQEQKNQSLITNDNLIAQTEKNKQKDPVDSKVEKQIQEFSTELKEKWKEDTKAFGAEGSEVTKKRSGTATDLMDSLLEWKEIAIDNTSKLSTYEKLEKLLELSQTTQNYCNTHNKLFHWTKDGSTRYKISKKIRDLTSKSVIQMLSEEDHKSIYNNNDADNVTGETPKIIVEKLKKAAKAYKNYSARLGNSCLGYMPGKETLLRRLQALRANERLIKRYRKERNDISDPDVDAYVKEYEECLAWEKLLNITKQKDDSLDKLIDDHLVEEGEIEKVDEKEKLKPEDSKENLSTEQRVGLEEIDNWLLRNFENGINKDADMVHGLLSMTKRERLHIYYLVEMERRRVADVSDVWLSQSYTPNLKTFRKKMVANRAMFWKKISGDYTYTFKLSEAMQIAKNYRTDLKTAAVVSTNKEEQKKKDVSQNANDKSAQVLQMFKDHLISLNELLQQLSTETDVQKKKALQERVDEMREECKKQAQAASETLKSLQKGDVHVDEADTIAFKVEEGNQLIAFLGSLPNTFDEKFAGGSPLIISAGITGLIGIVTGATMMIQNWSKYSDTERTERLFTLSTSIVNASAGVIGVGAMIASTSAKMVSLATTTATVAPVAGVVLSAGVTIVQGITAGKMKYHGKKASDFFKEKREKNAKLQQKSKMTEEEIQKKRELKYEKNMEELQKSLQKRQATKSVYSAVGTGIGAASIACPPLAIAALVVGIVGSIHDYNQVESLRTTLFDNFFNMEKLTRDVVKERFKNSRVSKDNPPVEKVKEALRLRVAARAGFNSVKTATVFICSKFARLIRNKLFDKNTSDDEKNGYISFVNSLDLRYNPDKGLPDENVLVRKMTAR